MPKPKISADLKEQVRFAVKNPVVWWKGTELPEEQIRPWEGGIHFAHAVLNGMQHGFTNMRHRIFVGMADGLVTPMMNSLHDVVGATFDALTDPPIGVHMDQKQYGVDILRKIMRFDATFNPLTFIFTIFNFGLSPWQRVSMWIVFGMMHSLVGTANGVSASKIWAGITPHTEQRGHLQLWRSVGETVGAMFSGVPNIFMGLRHVLGISDYQIMIFGSLLFLPVTIFARWLPSYAKQRVDFTNKVNADGETGTHETKLTFRETFAVVKHNRWFMMQIVIGLLRIFTPRADQMFLYRFLLPPIHFRGQQLGAELMFTAKDIVFGLPAFLAAPFAVQAMKMMRGPVNFIRIQVAVNTFTHLTSFLVGYRTLPRLVYMWTMEMFRGFFNQWQAVPQNVIEYEMFDYVEWKTGYRSEGLTQSVYGIINKLVRNNLTNIVGNAVTQWTGYMGWETPAEQQPERFMRTAWPLIHLGVVASEVIALAALLWFQYPHDPKDVERDLIERRALAQQLKEEAVSKESTAHE